MNKTISINLAGIVFHIEELGFEKLQQYIAALRRQFSKGSGGDEIIDDIESRIAELFSKKISPYKTAILETDVDEIIRLLGKPEELSDSSAESSIPPSQETVSAPTRKRFFRNPDEKMLGGVCGGIAAYFDFDPLWMRLAFALLFLMAGTGLLLYIILWIIIPEAKTASDRLEMRGDPINVQNIERQVKEALGAVAEDSKQFADKLKSGETKARVKKSAEHIRDWATDVFGNFFHFAARIFGFLITLFSIFILVVLVGSLMTGKGFLALRIPVFILNHTLTDSLKTWVAIGAILFFGIPFFMLLVNGIRLLLGVKTKMRRISFTLGIFWVISVGLLISCGFAVSGLFAIRASHQEEINLQLMPSKTIHLRLSESQPGYKVEGWHFGNALVEGKDELLIFRNVSLDIRRSADDSIHLMMTRSSRGEDKNEALKKVDQVNYHLSSADSMITFDDHASIGIKSFWRAQSVDLNLKIPVGYVIDVDEELASVLDDVSVADGEDYYFPGHRWKMTDAGLVCLNCVKSKADKNGNSAHISSKKPHHKK